MKRIITAILALLMATGCNGQEVKTHGRASQPNNLKSQNMRKSIVIFFSHAGDNYSVGNIEVGNTKIVVDYITEIKGADQFEIVTHEGSGLANCANDVKKAFPQANVTGEFSIYGHEVRGGKAKVEKWLKGL